MSHSMDFFASLPERPHTLPYADLRLLAHLHELPYRNPKGVHANYIAPSDELVDVGYRSEGDWQPARCFSALPLEVVVCIARSLPSPSLVALMHTCRLYRTVLATEPSLQSALRPPNVCGVHIFVTSTVSPYISPPFEEMLRILLCAYPALLVQCEIAAAPQHTASTDIFTVHVNGEAFDLQNVSPSVRRAEMERLVAHVDVLVAQSAPSIPPPLSPESYRTQPWYSCCDRSQCEKKLLKAPIHTFVLRPSSVPDAHVLSYRTRSGVYHALVRKCFDDSSYFSGSANTDGSLSGLYCSRMSVLVWFWRRQGLGRVWQLLTERT